MSYQGMTEFYKLPYMQKGDYLTASEEERRAKILDNLLYVATYGASTAIVEDASYSVSRQEDGSYTITLESLGSGYVFLALVNYRLAYRKVPVTIKNLIATEDVKYYVYVEFQDGMEIYPEICGINCLTEERNAIGHLLLCTLTFANGEAILDTDSNKRYLSNLAAHTMDSTNPHGQNLVQENLTVKKNLYLSDESHPLYPCIYRDIELQDTVSYHIETPFKPVFASASPLDQTVGNIYFEYGDNFVNVISSGDGKIKIKIEGKFV